MNEECTLVRRRIPQAKKEDAETRTVYVVSLFVKVLKVKTLDSFVVRP